ncbi:probable choline kinase 2 isoform X2 [Cornus florida]|uniref:probable choline kinase 2 isoform X2 n=1 Tax=Cornus florida TaxID=4283 RepID=UPI00289F16D3|nr:probable choline kinase 2 isoform X2 [Cornus florida]
MYIASFLRKSNGCALSPYNLRLAKIPKLYAPHFSTVDSPPPAFHSVQKNQELFGGHKTTALLRFFSSLRKEVPSSKILIHPRISCHHLHIGGSLVMGAVENAIDNKVGRLPEEAKRILQSLASSWGDVVESDALQVIQLKGAMTNEVYQIKWPTNEEQSRKVLVRIYGEGVGIFFDRNIEIQTFEFMSKHGQGPRLLGRFQNGRLEEFIHARTLSAPDLCDPDTSGLIAIKMKEFHDIDMPGPKNAFLWVRLRNWLNAAKSMSTPEEAEAFHFDALEEEISILEKKLSTDDQRIGFCHNDLQYGNIMFDEETRLITLIDYEYASYNPVAYDIANHFCEMAADYHTETPHNLDFSKYPGLEERKRFLRMYLSSSGYQPSEMEMEMEQLAQDVEKYTLASHLIWGLWGIISEHVNEIDFDYMEYARQRLQQYWLRKPELLDSFRATPDDVADGSRQ